MVMSLQEPFFLDRAMIMKMRIMMTIMLLLKMKMVLLMILKKIMMSLQEPFFLDRAVICSEQEGEMAAAARDHLDYFEIQEFGSKDSFVFSSAYKGRGKAPSPNEGLPRLGASADRCLPSNLGMA